MKKVFLLLLGIVVLWSFSLKNPPKNSALNLTPTPTLSPTQSEAVKGVSQLAPTTNSSPTNQVEVKRVVDGDTIELIDGRKLRYIGIDTPETVDPRKSVQCFGKEASAKNKELVEGKMVKLEKDVSETDKYGRLLRYVYLEDGTLINAYLVKNGFAHASSYPPDIKYQDLFRSEEAKARQANIGLWAGCPTSAAPVVLSGCVIKGNISSSGEKIYHLPGQKYYDQTVIDETRGEKWFCNTADAVTAGFRPSKL